MLHDVNDVKYNYNLSFIPQLWYVNSFERPAPTLCINSTEWPSKEFNSLLFGERPETASIQAHNACALQRFIHQHQQHQMPG